MKMQDALEGFKDYLKTQNKELQSLTPQSGIDAMLSFYRDKRVDSCNLENDDDMLLYQWGLSSWDGNRYTVNITRQLISEGGEDSDIWQLSLTFKFDSSELSWSFDSGNHWCENLTQLPQFELYIHLSEPYQTLFQRQPVEVELSCFCTG